jgi:hypothetical protein
MTDPKNWYRNCGDAIRKEFGSDADLFIDILAATSPRKQVSANWRLAMRIYHIWKIGHGWAKLAYDTEYDANLMTGTLPAHRKNIIRALWRESLSGNKVRAFAANLKGDLDAVTIDVWMQRYYGCEGTLTDKKYNELADRIRQDSVANGLEPAEYQAIIWCKAIEAAGRKPKSFLTVPNKGQQYFEFYFQGD